MPKRKSRFSEPGQEASVSAHGHGPIFEGDDFGCVGPGPQENDPPKSDILYYHYNNDINTIIIIRKTSEADKVSSYRQLRNRYKNKRTWATMELKLRKLSFVALSMGEGLYNASQWSGFIAANAEYDKDYDDIVDDLGEQLEMGFRI